MKILVKVNINVLVKEILHVLVKVNVNILVKVPRTIEMICMALGSGNITF
jgi:hypothetical protein